VSLGLGEMVAMDHHHTIVELATHQHAVVAMRQLRALGVPRWVIDQRIRRGQLVRLSPRVLRVAGSAPTPHQRAMAAVLDAGDTAALARASACALWGLPGYELEPVHVVRRYGRHGLEAALGVAHTTRDLREHHVVELFGIPVCTPARALVDLAGELPFPRLERLCDQAWARRLLSGAALHEIVAELGGRGRAGTVALRELLVERPIDHRPPESNLEARFDEIVSQVLGKHLERQVDLGDGDDWLGRVDFLDRSLKIVYEVQSDLYHSSVSDRARDRQRRRRLEAAGWIVVQIPEFDVWYRPDRVIAAVREAEGLARQRRVAA
jgi:very-short-patch-repair endonuclease